MSAVRNPVNVAERLAAPPIPAASGTCVFGPDPHYYRVQTPSFLIELDNTQDGANHIHSVWRDFAGDFGEDLLKEHYQTSHRGK